MSIGQKFLMASGGVGGETGWIRVFGDSGDSNSFTDVHIDSSGDIYAVGSAGYNYPSQTYYEGSVVKYNSDGDLQWQRLIEHDTSPDNNQILYCVTEPPNDSGKIAIIGYTRQGYSSGNTIRDRALIRRLYKSDGARYKSSVLTYFFGTSSAPGDVVYKNGVYDSNSNICLVGITDEGGGNTAFFIQKMDSNYNSLTGSFRKYIHGSANDEGEDIVVDSSNNIYIVGRTGSAGAGGYDQFIAKYNNTGTLQWQRCIGYGASPSNEQCNACTIDSSGDILVVGTLTPGATGASIIKVNSSGSLQSAIAYRDAVNTSTVPAFFDVAVDSNDNIYAVGKDGGNDALIMKFSSNGTLLWQNHFYASAVTYFNGIKIDGNNQPIVTGFSSGIVNNKNQALLLKLPSDGSGHGTYGYHTYASSSLNSLTLSTLPTVTTSTLSEATSGTSTGSDATRSESKTSTYTEWADYDIN